MKSFFKHIGLFICLAGTTGVAAGQTSAVPADSSRIVGGTDMHISAAPATVALLSNAALAQTGSFFQSQFCGGTVISSRWVLTAAHCVVQDNNTMPTGNISILMGATDLDAPINQPIGVVRVIPHPQYSDVSNTNDIALLELEYDSLVSPARLDTQNIALNDTALIAGWGALNMPSETQQQYFPSKLQGALVRMIPGDQCGTLYPRYSQQVDSRNLCAGVAAGGVDSCQGDSGGPLYRYDESHAADPRITGITSWGYGCAEADAPGVYIRVSAYADWVFATTGTGSSVPAQQPQEDDPGPITSQPPVSTSNLNTATSPSTNPQSLSIGAGSGSYWILGTLGLIIGLRIRRRRTLAAVPLLCIASLGCSLPATGQNHNGEQSNQGNVYKMVAHVSDSLRLADLPLGKKRDEAISMTDSRWLIDSSCTMVRTGVGNSRRAFFLETCSYTNVQGIAFCDEVPARMEYRFLENNLVQVAFDFDLMETPDLYRTCVSSQLPLTSTEGIIDVAVDNSFRTTATLSETVSGIHWAFP